MFEGFTRYRIAVDGAEIFCVAGGEGPPVLLLHGFPQTHALWARIAPDLVARGYRVICSDLRGYGASSKPQDMADCSFRAMAADQLAVMRALGAPRFHLVGHDRGGRTAHRMALDHPEAVASVTLMDIVPTLTLLDDLRMEVAQTYWHWFYLAQPEPFPERMIGADPDFFFETSLVGWGASKVADFDAEQMAAYRAAWRDPEAIRGACNDYRAALTVDRADDRADLGRRIAAPTLVLYGASGAMARLYDLPATWVPKFTSLQAEALPGGHFFPDLHPAQTAAAIARFLAAHPL
ncbi:alpha/beta hydrolase [Tabrizicola sp. J26]|uniref:alpha/beta hydrolase n=1 Tax=Alitabrizicola rongguiensis TaxID=2909234 RepID=UPI001F38C6E8|nr:alpha/beta hydrolase [Tabrizicola rongguiensis]MCF1710186.1 alpha/beta hydrolase [Tabrizicola rongguiensis]